MKQISIWLIFIFFFAGFSVVRPILVKRECKPVIQSSTLNVMGVSQKVHVYVRIVIRMEQLHLRVIGCVTYKALGLTSSQLATLAKDVWLGLIRESAGCPKADSVKWAGLRWKIFFFFAVLKWQLRERRAAREREASKSDGLKQELQAGSGWRGRTWRRQRLSVTSGRRAVTLVEQSRKQGTMFLPSFACSSPHDTRWSLLFVFWMIIFVSTNYTLQSSISNVN